MRLDLYITMSNDLASESGQVIFDYDNGVIIGSHLPNPIMKELADIWLAKDITVTRKAASYFQDLMEACLGHNFIVEVSEIMLNKTFTS